MLCFGVRSGGTSVVVTQEDAEQVQEEVEDVEVQADGDVNGVVEGRRDLAGTVHVVAHVESEEPRRQVVHDAEVLQARHEQLEDAHPEKAQECHEERTADSCIELREHQAGEAHEAGDHGGCESSSCHHAGLCQLVLSEHRAENGAEGDDHQVEADEGDEGVVAEVAQEDADDRQDEPDGQDRGEVRLPRGGGLRHPVSRKETPRQDAAECEVEPAARHGVATGTLPNSAVEHC